MRKKRKIILYILLVLFAAIFILSGLILITEYAMRERDSDTFDELVVLIEPIKDIDIVYDYSYVENNASSDASFENSTAVAHKRNLAPLISLNDECIGWIYIEDTKVNYPVMYTPNEPEKYLHLSFDLKYSAYGVPFLDYRCSESSDNLIIYGHNMKDGSMFATVRRYMDKEYFLEHPAIEFETVDGCVTYNVFAIASVKSGDAWYSSLEFDDREEYVNSVKRIMSKSLYETNVLPEYGKRIITLSTCYGAERDDRIILLAVED